MIIQHKLRATKDYTKGYLDNLTRWFAEAYEANEKTPYKKGEIERIEFLKADERGLLSISILTENGYNRIAYFNNQAELISYINGYMAYTRGF